MIKVLITGANGDVCNGIVKSVLYSNFEIDFYIAGNSKKNLKKNKGINPCQQIWLQSYILFQH